MIFHIHDHARGSLSVTKRPRPHPWLSEDIRNLRQAGITDIVCLLSQSESETLGLGLEEREAHRLDIAFHRIPIGDFSVPQSHLQWLDAITPLLTQLRNGHHLAAHCRASIGRATLFTASLLLCEGKSATQALRIIQRARGVNVPDTEEQVQWVHQLEEILKTHRAHLIKLTK